jgi:hypothetical protein
MVSWQCGDGCCSDSGITFQSLDRETNNMFCEYDWEDNKVWGHCLDNALIHMWEQLGREPLIDQDYTIKYWQKDCYGPERIASEKDFLHLKD